MSTLFRNVRTSSIGTVATQIGAYTAPSVTTGVVITGLSLANTNAASCNVSAYLWDGTTAIYLVRNAFVLPGGSISLADEGHRIVLNSGDQVFAVSSLSGSIDAIMSVSQIT